MTRRVTSPEFLGWLNQQLDTYHWNDSQASKLAGLDKGSISEIRRGINPGPKKCIALARLFNRPESEVLRLAGHLEPATATPRTSRPDTSGLPAETAEKMRRLASVLSAKPEAEQRRIMNAFLVLLEAEQVVGYVAQEDVLDESTPGQ